MRQSKSNKKRETTASLYLRLSRDDNLEGESYSIGNQKKLLTKVAKEKGYTFVHPFDDLEVATGQGTVGVEVFDELPDVDYILVPIGGGGLISGVAYALKTLKPSVKIYGVQAEGAPSMYNAVKTGNPEKLLSVSTFADGIAVKAPGENTFEYCKKYVDEMITVTEDEISAAILSLIENQKLIAEGAGAVSVAAVLFGKVPVEGKNVVCHSYDEY